MSQVNVSHTSGANFKAMFSMASGSSASRGRMAQHTLIASGVHVRGELVFSGVVYIQGRVDGNVTVSDEYSKLVVCENGMVNGVISVSDAVINGLVEGDLYVTHRLEINEKAVIKGNVYYNLLGIISGAEINGRLLKLSSEGQVRN